MGGRRWGRTRRAHTWTFVANSSCFANSCFGAAARVAQHPEVSAQKKGGGGTKGGETRRQVSACFKVFKDLSKGFKDLFKGFKDLENEKPG